ncbi:MAG: HU family DNA-binding protein [Gammaproteobacteria bacterium]
MANTVSTKQTKSQILSTLADETGLSKKEVTAVLDGLAELAHAHLKKGGSGEFTVPSLGVKLKRVLKPAREARKGTNPFTGEEIMIKAKPAVTSVKATALKVLKDAVA